MMTKLLNWIFRKETKKELPRGQNKPEATQATPMPVLQMPKVTPRQKIDMGETHAYTVAPRPSFSPMTEKQIEKEKRTRRERNSSSSSSPAPSSSPIADVGYSSWDSGCSSSDSGSSSCGDGGGGGD